MGRSIFNIEQRTLSSFVHFDAYDIRLRLLYFEPRGIWEIRYPLPLSKT